MYILYINIIWYVNVRAWVPYAIADLGSSKYTTCHLDGRPALTTGKTCNDHFQASWSPSTPLTATVGCGCALASLPECWWEVDQKKMRDRVLASASDIFIQEHVWFVFSRYNLGQDFNMDVVVQPWDAEVQLRTLHCPTSDEMFSMICMRWTRYEIIWNTFT